METFSVLLAGIALIVSVIVFIDNRIRDVRAARLARKPALIFEWDPLLRAWRLNNIGNGPALDVVILQHIRGEWCHALRMPEMAVADTNTVPNAWYGRWHGDPGLGAWYRSITGEVYTTETIADRSLIRDGPGNMTLQKEIEPHWRYRGLSDDEHINEPPT